VAYYGREASAVPATVSRPALQPDDKPGRHPEDEFRPSWIRVGNFAGELPGRNVPTRCRCIEFFVGLPFLGTRMCEIDFIGATLIERK
jgi:hypothetical protein